MKTDDNNVKCEYGIFNLPARLYKYYPYDSNLNTRRLVGDVYLASPHDFNDPCDCRIPVNNNAKDLIKNKEEGWLEGKMKELGYYGAKAKEMSVSLIQGDEHLDEVYERQLQKLGILCTTQEYEHPLMWGYYTNNNGICVEYDTKELISALVVGFVNQLNYETTKLLFEEKKYKDKPVDRCADFDKKVIENAEKTMLTKGKLPKENPFLTEVSTAEVQNFMVNILLKRFAGKKIDYRDESEVPGCHPQLFFDRTNESCKAKYYVKTNLWKHENEFRIIVSLGGRKVVRLGPDVIKNVYIGCNTPEEKIVEIAYVLASNQMKCGLYLMNRCSSCTLNAKKIAYEKQRRSFSNFKTAISVIRNTVKADTSLKEG